MKIDYINITQYYPYITMVFNAYMKDKVLILGSVDISNAFFTKTPSYTHAQVRNM